MWPSEAGGIGRSLIDHAFSCTCNAPALHMQTGFVDPIRFLDPAADGGARPGRHLGHPNLHIRGRDSGLARNLLIPLEVASSPFVDARPVAMPPAMLQQCRHHPPTSGSSRGIVFGAYPAAT
jgi:hypothetical protein